MPTFHFLRPPKKEGDLGSLGVFRVIRLIGDGAMGFVFLAEEPALDRRLALKVLRPELSSSEGGRERFIREAKASAKVESDHVVTIFQVGEDNGVPFIAMELLEGMSLQAWISRRQNLASIPSVFKVARDLFRGLADAHKRGLVHRDIKPSNLWIERRSGRIKILDFGLTKIEEGSERATRSGTILGTPAYMAPEQANGMPVDQRADLFSASLVLYELLTGKNPFQRQGILATLKAIGHEEAPAVTEIRKDTPPLLASLLISLLKKEPKERPSGAAEVLKAIAAAEQQFRATGEQIVAVSEDSPESLFDRPQEKPPSKDSATLDSDPGSFVFGKAAQIQVLKTWSFSPKRIPLPWVFAGTATAIAIVFGLLLLLKAPVSRETAELGKTEETRNPVASVKSNPPARQADVAKDSKSIGLPGDPFQRVAAELIQKNKGISEPIISRVGVQLRCELKGDVLRDLSPLASLPELSYLHIHTPSQISDLSPLKGLPLTFLCISNAQITDLGPLEGAPLGDLILNDNNVGSLEPLKNCPLGALRIMGTNVRSIEPLKELRFLKYLEMGNCPVTDFSPLAKLPLVLLNLNRTKFSEIELLAGKPLETLDISFSGVKTLEPLRGCPLSTLRLGGLKIKDLTPLSGMKIKNLQLGDVSGVDLSVLKTLPMEDIAGIPEPVGEEYLKAWPFIKRINGKEVTP